MMPGMDHGTILTLGARNLGGAILDHHLARGWRGAAVARSEDTLARVRERGALALGVRAMPVQRVARLLELGDGAIAILPGTLELAAGLLHFLPCRGQGVADRVELGPRGLEAALQLQAFGAERLALRVRLLHHARDRLGGAALGILVNARRFLRKPAVPVGPDRGQLALEPRRPLGGERLELRGPARLCLRRRCGAGGQQRLVLPALQPRELELQLFLQAPADRVDGGANELVGHFQHYREGGTGSQAGSQPQVVPLQQLDAFQRRSVQ
jgi:hypothetical protein